jgi:hypothetical protein
MGGGLLAGDGAVTIVAMGESVDEARSGDEGQAEAEDESRLAELAVAEQPDGEQGPPRDEYVPV